VLGGQALGITVLQSHFRDRAPARGSHPVSRDPASTRARNALAPHFARTASTALALAGAAAGGVSLHYLGAHGLLVALLVVFGRYAFAMLNRRLFKDRYRATSN
jgi:hypothetical protein